MNFFRLFNSSVKAPQVYCFLYISPLILCAACAHNQQPLHSSNKIAFFRTCRDRDYVNQFDLFENNKCCRYEKIEQYGCDCVYTACICFNNNNNHHLRLVKINLIACKTEMHVNQTICVCAPH